MDANNRALAYLLRHPPAVWAVKPLSYGAIAAHHVIKADGSRPDRGTVRKAVKAFKKLKKKRGRACGWRKTTSEEDATILSVFRKLRPPGHGVTAPDVHRGLPLRLRRKLSVETVRLRLAAKGYHYFEKMESMPLHRQSPDKLQGTVCDSVSAVCLPVCAWRLVCET